ncbi:MAG: metal ABC transporter permease [Gemmatimonadales bacterium]|nr:MAG: metal ABC transporter permease [Gemmatimonadales bacterium]
MVEALSYPFFQRALIAGLLASIACGVVGTFVVVRGMASISGGLAHAAFGGVGLGYLAGFDPTLGALGFGLASALGVEVAERRLKQGIDTLVAMVWAVGMAVGLVFIALAPGAEPDLMGYLFGNILFVPTQFLLFIAVLDLVIVGAVLLLFRRLEAVAFDEEFAWVIGMPVEALSLLLLALVATTVVILIRVVGVILVIALLTMPAAIARHWTEALVPMMVLATIVGAVCITFGLFFSWTLSSIFSLDVPTGPAIILLTAIVYAVSAVSHRTLNSRRRSVS